MIITTPSVYVLGWHGQIGVQSLTPENATSVKLGLECQSKRQARQFHFPPSSSHDSIARPKTLST